MELYVKVYFWLGVVATVLRFIEMAGSSWPKRKEKTLGMMVAETLIGIGLTVWAGILLYAQRPG